ncbi:Oidioi.mRNA.OKI2018_I69.chr2.g6643.t1.cds [Oikopleura dioica]|uniref:ADP/ATP translocase n=1 Tax=Oikopleura dioica TaxID=34765 RepID=A0ABN7T442_OIKDI|nr:Oidioi.mRNA.OKI2018_I69.chr2.g6643.t1.cds [Oikopleura dioica]
MGRYLSACFRPYRGVLDCAKRVFKNDGFLSFWRGNWVNCVRYIPTQAMNFTIKDTIQDLFPVASDATFRQKLFTNLIAGGVAGGMSLLVVYPLDFARNRLAADLVQSAGNRKFSGTLDCFRKIVKSDGVVGLYRGFALGVYGISMYRAIYFGVYDTVKPILERHSQTKIGFVPSFLLGYVISIVASIPAYPTDTLRRRMMMTSGTGENYSSSISAFRTIYAQEGIIAFFRGWNANLLRAIAPGLVLASKDKFTDFYLLLTRQ